MDILNYIEGKYREIKPYENIEFCNLYSWVKQDELKTIFSTVHHLIVENYSRMNDRLPTKEYTAHFWAENSRQLLLAIETIQGLSRVLIGSEYAFNIAPYYSEIIEKSEKFLSNSGGSVIPPYMEKVEIYYKVPIFISGNLVDISFGKERSQYSDLKSIGEGSYAKVYKYKDAFYHKMFALKRAKKELNDNEIERFHREYDVMKKLHSPYVVEVYNYLNSDEYIMEYMDCSLRDFMDKNNQGISYSKRRNLLNQVLKAFQYIHSKNLMHRDVNPSNILLKIYDDVIVVKISDLGLVKLQDSQLTNIDTDMKGYFNDPGLSTEGFQNYDIRHETYALTRVVFFILTGKTTVNNIKNTSLNEFVQKGLSTDKVKRYKSIEEMIYAVSKIKEF